MKEVLILVSILFLIGCGGGGGSTTVTEDPLPAGTEKMAAGQTYQVSPGDQVVKTSKDAQIRVAHVYGEANSSVELIEGDANLVKNL